MLNRDLLRATFGVVIGALLLAGPSLRAQDYGGVPYSAEMKEKDQTMVRECLATVEANSAYLWANPALWAERAAAARYYAGQVYAMSAQDLLIEERKLGRELEARQRETAAAPSKAEFDDASYRQLYTAAQLQLVTDARARAVAGFVIDRQSNALTAYVQHQQQNGVEAFQGTVELCVEDFEKLQKDNAGSATAAPSKPDGGEATVNFAGTYTNGSGSTLTISGGGGSWTAVEKWTSGASHGTTNWSGCVADGDTLKCNWTGDYLGDPDKTADRSGTLTASLDGDSLTGSYVEKAPNFHWSPNVAPYGSSMHEGAVWSINHTRKR